VNFIIGVVTLIICVLVYKFMPTGDDDEHSS